MSDIELVKALLTTLGVMATAYFGYLAATRNARSSANSERAATGATLLTDAVTEWKKIGEDARKLAEIANAKADALAAALEKERAHSQAQDVRIGKQDRALHVFSAYLRAIRDGILSGRMPPFRPLPDELTPYMGDDFTWPDIPATPPTEGSTPNG